MKSMTKKQAELFEQKTQDIKKILVHLGEDPNREGLLGTPSRVVRSWDTLYGGYSQCAEEVLQTQFEADYDEMVVLKDIEFYSTCEHHMLPFFGKANIAYLPQGKVVGISKLARLVEIYARRLQIQEKLTTQISESIMEYIQPKGCGVVIEAKHFCMVCRGVEKQNSLMVTSSLKGEFQENEVKQEFFQLINYG
jgi:GTP cyclohydrolase I